MICKLQLLVSEIFLRLVIYLVRVEPQQACQTLLKLGFLIAHYSERSLFVIQKGSNVSLEFLAHLPFREVSHLEETLLLIVQLRLELFQVLAQKLPCLVQRLDRNVVVLLVFEKAVEKLLYLVHLLCDHRTPCYHSAVKVQKRRRQPFCLPDLQALIHLVDAVKELRENVSNVLDLRSTLQLHFFQGLRYDSDSS